MPSTCRSCGAAIRWTQTNSGKRMPVDAAPHPDGNVYVDFDSAPPAAAVYAPAHVPPHTVPLYRSHFATCPHATMHRHRPA